MLNDKIKAGKHFKLESYWRFASLKWCMYECQKKEEKINWEKIRKICTRFKIGDAFSFYHMNPNLYF